MCVSDVSPLESGQLAVCSRLAQTAWRYPYTKVRRTSCHAEVFPYITLTPRRFVAARSRGDNVCYAPLTRALIVVGVRVDLELLTPTNLLPVEGTP